MSRLTTFPLLAHSSSYKNYLRNYIEKYDNFTLFSEFNKIKYRQRNIYPYSIITETCRSCYVTIPRFAAQYYQSNYYCKRCLIICIHCDTKIPMRDYMKYKWTLTTLYCSYNDSRYWICFTCGLKHKSYKHISDKIIKSFKLKCSSRCNNCYSILDKSEYTAIRCTICSLLT
jgi:hypothetical protein